MRTGADVVVPEVEAGLVLRLEYSKQTRFIKRNSRVVRKHEMPFLRH